MLKKIISTFGIKVLIAVLNLVIVIVLSNYIGASGKGEASFIVISMAMVMLFCNLLGGSTLIYLTPRYNIFLLFFLSNTWSVLTTIGAFAVLHFYGEVSICMNAHICLLSLFNSLLATNLTILLAKERVNLYNLLSLLQTMLTLIVVILLFEGKTPNILSYVYALYVAMGVCLIISMGYMLPYLKKPSLHHLPKHAYEFLKLGFTNQSSQIIKFLSFRISYYLLMKYQDTSVLGVFSNGTSLIESLLLISNSFVAVLYPKISNSINKKYAQLLTVQMTKMSVAFCILALIPLSFLPSRFWLWLFGEGFKGVRQVILLLAPGIVFYNISMMINHYFSGLGKYRVSTVAYSVGLIMMVIGSALVIPNYGIREAAVLSSLSYIATAVFYMIYFSKDAKINVNKLFPTLSDIPWFFKRLKGYFFN
ncbi:MAG TPA: polysaccharide biosynthesis C-terminal domain-containing protein [Bacteroidia bacterium]|jgi:O-antigen/teichoic acid export membrane protein|nr:polysaccharide biosynthesis C-terminal domain-containing protein [Bacteroidia bacterium]